MTVQILRKPAKGTNRAHRHPAQPPLEQILRDMRAVEPGNLLKAMALCDREEVTLGDILLTHGWVSSADLMAALSRQWSAEAVDPAAKPPDARLIDRLGVEFCLRESVLPWRRLGGATVIATARPERFAELCARLPADFGPVAMALASEDAIRAALVAARSNRLADLAQTRVAADQSCRRQGARGPVAAAYAVPACIALGLLLWPLSALAAISAFAVTSLMLFTGLKFIAFLSLLRVCDKPAHPGMALPARLPVVSVLVPLFRETDIAHRLVERLGKISYPRELFDVLLITEQSDHQTRDALARARLPRWMRVITVPEGPIRTKPRALNYALDFARGAIIGVWDAEDIPASDQIHKVVRQFHNSGPEVACLQGILDYYNARHNWLSRCFTIEYAALFRVILPGLSRLGLVLPLGGTTLFLRREALEQLGRWDAHNVTEDADLGVRLARAGYRTEMIDTVTEEEPNCRPLPWIKQRSRWLKGFAMTWATHMRDPARLWRELGARQFIGIQVFFIGTLSQFLLAPVLWSFWLLLFGLPHPLAAQVAPGAVFALAGAFVAMETINITIGAWAVRGPGHRHLVKWVPSLLVYFPLATLAAYKAAYEWVVKPFYWDKTVHGVIETCRPEAAAPPALILVNPVRVPKAGAALPRRLSPPALGILPAAPRPLGSTIADVSRRPRIELQPCLEGLGDM
ncbi:MAG: glycosyltransferase [Rhodobacteraceae bacterium]|nr:glycosyltransferase [Paracoccaceae bacterium]